MGWIPGSERSPGVGNGNPLQCSCLENPMDRGAWLTTVSPWGWDLKESDTTEHTHTHLQWGREAQNSLLCFPFCLLYLRGILQFLRLPEFQPLLGSCAPILPLLWPAPSVFLTMLFWLHPAGTPGSSSFWCPLPRWQCELHVPDRVLLPRALAGSFCLVGAGCAVWSYQSQEGFQGR